MSSDVADGLEALPERVDRIEHTLDAFTVSVDQRFEQVNRRFDDIDRRFEQVDEHFAEQRAYTEFAYERLDRRITGLERAMLAGFDRLEAAIHANTASITRLEGRLPKPRKR